MDEGWAARPTESFYCGVEVKIDAENEHGDVTPARGANGFAVDGGVAGSAEAHSLFDAGVPKSRIRFGLVALGTLMLLAPLALSSHSGIYLTATTAGIYAIVVLSLQWVVGYAGMLSLGHPALFGVAAYSSAVLTAKFAWPFGAAFVVGVLASLAVATLLLPTLRLHGVYFALATLTGVLLLNEALYYWSNVTGGPSGLTGIPAFPGQALGVSSRHVAYYLAWGLVLLLMWLSSRLKRMRMGRALHAIASDEDVAKSLGIYAAKARVHIWLASSVVTGIAGVLYAHHVRFLSPGQFGVGVSITILAMLIVGGIRSVGGAVVATLLFTLLPAFLRPLREFQELVFGALLILVMVVAPGGLGDIGQGIVSRVKAVRRRRMRTAGRLG